MLRLLTFLALCGLSTAQNQCFEPRLVGDTSCGTSGGQRFYFDSHTHRCQPFSFRGCNGSGNNFSSRQECESTCNNAVQSDASSSSSAAVCSSGAFAAGATVDQPDSCSNCPNGYSCENNLCCPTKDYLCNLNYDAGKFGAVGKHTPRSDGCPFGCHGGRYFYNKDYNTCMLFTFYGKAGNANNFATFNECRNFCAH